MSEIERERERGYLSEMVRNPDILFTAQACISFHAPSLAPTCEHTCIFCETSFCDSKLRIGNTNQEEVCQFGTPGPGHLLCS